MSGLTYLEAVNDPGVPGRSGDDRYGFDESGGRAWVLDGATDVSPLQPFSHAESGAAWLADAISTRLVQGPQENEDAETYWTRVLEDVRTLAARASTIPLGNLPVEASPIASGIWVRSGAEQAELVMLGDCFALIDDGSGHIQTIGSKDKPEDEAAWARKLLTLEPEERNAALRDQRRQQNTEDHWIFGLDPEAARHLEKLTIKLGPGAEILLMTDGFYRLVSPYRLQTSESLFDLVRGKNGLLGAIRLLRSQEASDSDDARLGRIKTRDDACCLWLRVE